MTIIFKNQVEFHDSRILCFLLVDWTHLPEIRNLILCKWNMIFGSVLIKTRAAPTLAESTLLSIYILLSRAWPSLRGWSTSWGWWLVISFVLGPWYLEIRVCMCGILALLTHTLLSGTDPLPLAPLLLFDSFIPELLCRTAALWWSPFLWRLVVSCAEHLL